MNSPTGCVEFLNDIDRILTSSFSAQTAEDYRHLDGKQRNSQKNLKKVFGLDQVKLRSS